MIPESIVDEVRARADIVEIIGEHVQLKRAGKEYKALCPFHNEKTPSFYVVPAKGFYKCFGCGESGDVFSFLMQRQGLEFPEVLRALAARVGVEVPEAAAERPREDEQTRALLEVMAFADDFYQRQLREAEAGEAARRYLERRGLDHEAAERFGLGYAPDAWRGLLEAAAAHEIAPASLLEAGLAKVPEQGGEPYDRFRNRLTFPIRDNGGRTIAFGGRILGADGPGAPKYLNSPETPLYHKGRVLYGLSWSRHAIRREEAALVVEGYMDFVSLAARGVENVVAPLGTALTEEQATLLARYTRKAFLLYDSDAAGLRATFRSADALLQAGVHPLVVTLPEGEDPDSMVQKEGGRPFGEALAAAVDVVERKLEILAEHGYLEDIQGMRRSLDGLLPTVRAAADPALRDLYVERIARATGVRPETILDELAREPKGAPAPGRTPPAGERAPRRQRTDARQRGATTSPAVAGSAGQRKLLLLMLRDRERVADAAAALEPDEFTDDVHRELFVALVAAGADPAGDWPPPLPALEGDAAERYARLLGDPEELTDTDRMYRELVADIKSEGLYHRLDELVQLMPLAESRGDAELFETMLRERVAIAKQLQAMGKPTERMAMKRARLGRVER